MAVDFGLLPLFLLKFINFQKSLGYHERHVRRYCITQCYSAGLLTSCRLLQGGDHIESGVRYTYKDCASETVNKLCYGGACVECLSDTDCPSTKPKCDTSTHTCKEATTPTPTCNYNGIQDNGETGVDCGGGGCPACASACTATLSFPTVGTGDPCSVSATISATGCDGKSYQVKEGSTSKCSGTVSGGSASCSFSQSGAKSYDLYVDSAKMDTESATCGTPPITGCSAYNGDAGNCNSAGG